LANSATASATYAAAAPGRPTTPPADAAKIWPPFSPTPGLHDRRAQLPPRAGDAEADLIAWRARPGVPRSKVARLDRFRSAERAIGDEKRRHLLRLARAYIRKSETPWNRSVSTSSRWSSPPAANQLMRNAIPSL